MWHTTSKGRLSTLPVEEHASVCSLHVLFHSWVTIWRTKALNSLVIRVRPRLCTATLNNYAANSMSQTAFISPMFCPDQSAMSHSDSTILLNKPPTSKNQSQCQCGDPYDDKCLDPTAELLTGTKMWRQNSCGTRVEWKLLSTLIAPPAHLLVSFLAAPRWVLQSTDELHNTLLSVPIIKAQRDCQDNAPHNNWLHKFTRLLQHVWSRCLIAVSAQLSYREKLFFLDIYFHPVLPSHLRRQLRIHQSVWLCRKCMQM